MIFQALRRLKFHSVSDRLQCQVGFVADGRALPFASSIPENLFQQVLFQSFKCALDL